MRTARGRRGGTRCLVGRCGNVAVVSVQGVTLCASCRNRFARRRCRLDAAGVEVGAFKHADVLRELGAAADRLGGGERK